MQRPDQRTNPRRIATRQNPNRWPAIKVSSYPLPNSANRSSGATADATLEFGRCRVMLRRRQLLADGFPVELGTRAFDLLLVMLEADGLLLSKEELLSRVWPGIVVSEENLKVQMSALRKALGADRDVIRTEFGRGYRFTGELRFNAAPGARRPGRTVFPQNCRQSLGVVSIQASHQGGERNRQQW